jgi:allantoicase
MNTDPSIPSFVTDWVNLADPRLGARAISASDEFFAPKEGLLGVAPAVFVPDKYGPVGKWMDGWETRRRRDAGHDWCVVRLGLPGVIKGFDIDTSHFTGNYPQAASIECCHAAEDDPGPATQWTTLVAAMALKGNSHHYVPHSDIGAGRIWTHVRLNIFPDGGVARLRVYGQVACDWSARSTNELYDLAAVQNGGRAIACNDAHFGRPNNMLGPGRGVNMGDGWETRRRREPGHDWAIIKLGHSGKIAKIVVDTAHFKGNYPDRCSVQAALAAGVSGGALIAQSMFWPALLSEQKLSADAIHEFTQLNDLGAVSHIRLNIIPDGGVSRIRVLGYPQG